MKSFPFYLLIAFIPLGVITRFYIFPQLAVSILDIIVLCILLLNFRSIYLFLRKKNIYTILFFLIFLLGCLGTIIHVSSIFEFFVSMSYSLRFFSYILLLIPILSLPHKSIIFMKKELLFSGFIFIFLGYVQYFYYPSLRNLYYLGWDEHLYRLFSTLLDPNFAGVYALLIFYLFLSFDIFYKKNFLIGKFLVFITGSIYILAAFFLTYSRSSYVAFIISSLLFVFLIGKKRMLLVLFLVFTIGILLLPKGFGGEGVNLTRTASIFARVNAVSNGLYIFMTSPVIGVGFNTLRFTNVKLGLISPIESITSHAANGIPNSYIFILATTGIVGVLLYLVLGVYFLREVIYRMKQEKGNTYMGGAILASICTILVQSFFENSFFYTPFVLWMILVFGIFFNKSSDLKK